LSSDLIGQGGWAGFGPTQGVVSTMIINDGTYLDSKVIDGRDPAGSGWIMAAAKSLESLSTEVVTTLTVDTYSTSDPPTINGGVGFGKNPAPVGFSFDSFTVFWNVSATTGWEFDTRAIGGTRVGFPGGMNRLVSLQIVVDGPAREVYGVIEDAVEGRRLTECSAIPAEVVAELDTVSLFVDKTQNRTGPEFDNIEVVVSPAVTSQIFGDWMASFEVPAGLTGPTDDPNGDGFSNIVAFFAGIPPMDNGLNALPRILKHDDGRITMEFPRSSVAVGVNGFVEVSTDGIAWTRGPAGTVSDQTGTIQSLSAELNTLVHQAQLARLKYEMAP